MESKSIRELKSIVIQEVPYDDYRSEDFSLFDEEDAPKYPYVIVSFIELSVFLKSIIELNLEDEYPFELLEVNMSLNVFTKEELPDCLLVRHTPDTPEMVLDIIYPKDVEDARELDEVYRKRGLDKIDNKYVNYVMEHLDEEDLLKKH